MALRNSSYVDGAMWPAEPEPGTHSWLMGKRFPLQTAEPGAKSVLKLIKPPQLQGERSCRQLLCPSIEQDSKEGPFYPDGSQDTWEVLLTRGIFSSPSVLWNGAFSRKSKPVVNGGKHPHQGSVLQQRRSRISIGSPRVRVGTCVHGHPHVCMAVHVRKDSR